MNQVWHIFRKDVCHFWVEILVSIVITAAFAVIYPHGWLKQHGGGGFGVGTMGAFYATPAILVILVPLSWWLLITRVVQEEGLVGDRQFWVTRPYEWKQLLAAKALFLAAFLYLPIFIAQCVILAEVGFHPLAYLPGLLFNLLLITGILVVPLFALATVTSNFARMTLTLLAILLCIAGAGAMSAYIDTQSVSIPYGDRLSIPLVLGVAGSAIILQYAVRRVWLSRLLLAILSISIGLIVMATPTTLLMEHAYPRPASAQDAPANFEFEQGAMNRTLAYGRTEKQVTLNLFLHVSGVAAGYAVIPNDVKISIDAAKGAHWESGWQGIYNQHFLPQSKYANVQPIVSRAFYEQIKSSPVTLHLTFALTQVRSGKVTRMELTGGQFVVPDFGVCLPQTMFGGSEIFNIACRSALRQPQLTYVTAMWSDARCSEAKNDTDHTAQGDGWTGTLDHDPAEFGIASVWDTSLYLRNDMPAYADLGVTPKPTGQGTRQLGVTVSSGMMNPRHLCPGTPLTFTQYSVVRRTQTELTIPNVSLPDIDKDKGSDGILILRPD